MKKAAVVLLVVGLSQMTGDLLRLPALKAIRKPESACPLLPGHLRSRFE